MSVNRITPEEARSLLNRYLESTYIIHHSIETGVIMKALAERLREETDLWYCAGILHDLDMDVIEGNYSLHGDKTVEILKEEGYDIPELFQAILAHTEILDESNRKRSARLDYALAGAENLTGLIYAYVLMRPGKKLIGTKASSIRKKMKDRSFAATVNRSVIQEGADHLDMELSEFISLSLEALEEVADELGM